VDFSRVQGVAVHVFQGQSGPQLRVAIELISPANKDWPRSRFTLAAKCVGSSDAAFRVPNGTVLNVFPLVKSADTNAVGGSPWKNQRLLRTQAFLVFLFLIEVHLPFSTAGLTARSPRGQDL
jgi:hypothetical protein